MPTRPTLDYRNPATVQDHHVDRVKLALQAREGLFWLRTGLSACAGVAASLVGPLFVASIIWVIVARLGVVLPFDRAMFVWLFAAALLVLLFWYERRTKGQFLSQSLDDNRAWFPGRASSSGEFEARYRVAAGMVLVELLLWGPRLLMNSFDRCRVRQSLRHANLTRAAEVVADLQRCDGGVLIGTLQRAGESLAELRGTLGYLSLFDWIGVSRDGTRTWLLSDARKRLDSR